MPRRGDAAGRIAAPNDSETADEDGRLYLNGIDALTGLPAVPPMAEEEAAQRAAGGPPLCPDCSPMKRAFLSP